MHELLTSLEAHPANTTFAGIMLFFVVIGIVGLIF